MIICTAAAGLLLGLLLGLLAGLCIHIRSMRQRPAPPTIPARTDQERAARRAQKEYENFLTYDGTEQEDILI